MGSDIPIITPALYKKYPLALNIIILLELLPSAHFLSFPEELHTSFIQISGDGSKIGFATINSKS